MERKPKIYIETYGCQMNVADSEVVVSIMQGNGYSLTDDINESDVMLINTCSIRDNAEQRVWGRLDVFNQVKRKKPEIIIGVIGCMAERLKNKLLEKTQMVDLVIGPDAYRDLPNLLNIAGTGQKAINVILSQEETYGNINPVRLDKNKVSAFVSIMRGCNNMCTYCVVPYTRGAERSREPLTILKEVEMLINNGYKEVTLLGQNVNSYHYSERNEIIDFPKLMGKVASLSTNLRVRFSTSHPKDISKELLKAMASYKNICNHIHLPVQSGSTRILGLMNRGYTREKYLEQIQTIKRILPEAALSTDIITGFCSETDQDHLETLSLMKEVGYDFAYMFKYSERPNTKAARKYADDIPEALKTKRLTEIINLQNKLSAKSKKHDIGKVFEVLAEGISKKSQDQLFGRTSQNKVVVFPKNGFKAGDYISVKITECTSATLIGEII